MAKRSQVGGDSFASATNAARSYQGLTTSRTVRDRVFGVLHHPAGGELAVRRIEGAEGEPLAGT